MNLDKESKSEEKKMVVAAVGGVGEGGSDDAFQYVFAYFCAHVPHKIASS